MATRELQVMVTLEAIILVLICSVICFAFKRWKIPLYISSAAATAVLFYAWSPLIALGSACVYGPASMLLWIELDKRDSKQVKRRTSLIQAFCWPLLALGVIMIIVHNVHQIYVYLH